MERVEGKLLAVPFICVLWQFEPRHVLVRHRLANYNTTHINGYHIPSGNSVEYTRMRMPLSINIRGIILM